MFVKKIAFPAQRFPHDMRECFLFFKKFLFRKLRRIIPPKNCRIPGRNLPGCGSPIILIHDCSLFRSDPAAERRSYPVCVCRDPASGFLFPTQKARSPVPYATTKNLSRNRTESTYVSTETSLALPVHS